MSDRMRGDKRLSLDKASIVRLDKAGKQFEILVDPDLAWKHREGQEIDIADIIQGYTIFEDALKGKRATEEALMEIFNTAEPREVAEYILKHGRVQITSAKRKELIEQKKRQIIDFLTRNTMNPQTGYPHPPQRIERALDETQINIDPFKSGKEQAKNAIKELMPILPIRMEQIRIAIKIPAEFSGAGYGAVSRFGKITSDEWQRDGSWIGIVEIPAGLHMPLIDELNKQTKGKVQIKTLDKTG